MNKPTPTEIAFAKAAAFDKIAGYVLENSKGSKCVPKQCSRDLQVRYMTHDDFHTNMILGLLEEHFNSRRAMKLTDNKIKDGVITTPL